MKIVSFIEARQHEVIDRIIRHCGLQQHAGPSHAGPRAPPSATVLPPSAPPELRYLPDPDYLEAIRHEQRRAAEPA
jgi:hypothetical protein